VYNNDFKLDLHLDMNFLKARQRSGIYFRTMLVVFTLSYCCLILYAYKSDIKKSLSYKYRGFEVIEIQHTPSPRLLLYHMNGFHSAGIEVIPSIFQSVRTNVFLSKAIDTLYAFNAFYAFTTINAP